MVTPLDPRIKRIRQEEKEAREAKKKKGKVNDVDAKAEAEKKRLEEEAKKKEEEEKVGFKATMLTHLTYKFNRLLLRELKRRRQKLQLPTLRRRHVGRSELWKAHKIPRHLQSLLLSRTSDLSTRITRLSITLFLTHIIALLSYVFYYFS